MDKAQEIGLVHFRFTRRDIVQFAIPHPLFKAIDKAEQMIEGVNDKQQRLLVMDLAALDDRPLELNRETLPLRRFARMS